MKNSAVLIAAVIFGILALVHLSRMFCPFDVTIGSFAVPVWFSCIFFIIGGMMSGYLFRAMYE